MNIKTVGVIGAGTMGNGIAQVCAVAGLKVIMQDIGQAQVDNGDITYRPILEDPEGVFGVFCGWPKFSSSIFTFFGFGPVVLFY